MAGQERAGITVENLSCRYREEYVFSGLGFSVKKARVTGIIGPNGSGKTTLLRCLVKLLPLETGRIFLGEEELANLSVREIAVRVGVVPQRWEANFAFTAGDLVLMGRFPHVGRLQRESAKDYEIARQAMETTGIRHLAGRPVTELSGGELQRVMIAQALAQTPEILLLDEPTSHLDLNYQIETGELLQELCRDTGMTVVAVFHDLNLAARYCDELILLAHGRILAQGEAGEVLTAENLHKAYGVKARVKKDLLTGRPYVSFLPFGKTATNNLVRNGQEFKVHLIGGGGSTAGLIWELSSLGCRLSTGVLHRLDRDWEAARELGVSIIEETPFSPVGETAHRRNLEMIGDADLVVLGNIPVGPVNIKNLEAAAAALAAGKELLVCDFSAISDRDFTGGRAAAIYEKLQTAGAVFLAGPEELTAAVRQRIK
jgi:iron complex transport system ATP-binding protein